MKIIYIDPLLVTHLKVSGEFKGLKHSDGRLVEFNFLEATIKGRWPMKTKLKKGYYAGDLIGNFSPYIHPRELIENMSIMDVRGTIYTRAKCDVYIGSTLTHTHYCDRYDAAMGFANSYFTSKKIFTHIKY